MRSGSDQFKEWMKRRVFTQREAAKHFGWDETFLSHMLSGRRNPGLTNAVKIERETGITVEAWVASEVDKSVSVTVGHARKRTA